MQFDPMTGKPIEEEQKEVQKEAQEVQKEKSEVNFDPMTGEPVNRQEQDQEVNFDPMTGEPVNRQDQDQGVNFDPMTGERIGAPVQNQRSQRKLLIMAGSIAGAVIILILLILGGIRSGLFLSKSGKVLLATNNTLKDMPHFVETLEATAEIFKDEYTVEFNTDEYGVEIGGAFISADKQKQLTARVEYGGDTIEGLAGLDSDSVKLQVPALSNKVFVYNYKGKNNGAIMDYVDEDEIDMINSMLGQLSTSGKDADKLQKKITGIIAKEWKSLKFKSVGKEKFTVNDKDVKCKGYQTTITGDNIWNVMEGSFQVMEEQYPDLYQYYGLTYGLYSYYGAYDFEDAMDDMKDEMRDALDDMEDIDITIYLYKNQLAAIIIESEDFDDDIKLYFEGGDYRLQNIVLKSGSERISLKGSDDGKTEEFKLRVNGSYSGDDTISLKYDYGDDGRFKIDDGYDSVSGKLYKKGKTVNLSIDGNDSFPDLEFTVTKGAKLQKFKGVKFDIGNADEDEIEDLVDDISDELYDYDLMDALWYIF